MIKHPTVFSQESRQQTTKDMDVIKEATLRPKDVSRAPLVNPPLPKMSNLPKTLPDDQTTDQVANMCLFACDKCPFESNSWGGMRNHNLKSGHGPGNTRFDPKYVKEARYHKCTICSRILLCEAYLIVNHILESHNLKLDAYLNRTSDQQVANCDQQNKENEVLRKKITCMKKPTERYKRSTLPKGTLIDEQMTSKVANLCTFVCLQCPFKAKSVMELEDHKSKKGHFKQKEVGTFLFKREQITEARYHKCKICSVAVLCDEELIRRHVKVAHRIIKFEKYLQMIEEKDKKVSKITKKSATDLKQSYKTLPKSICPKSMVSKSLENLCLWSCDKCEFTKPNWPTFREHKRANHGDGRLEFLYDPKYLLEAKYYQCEICEEYVLCDRGIFTSHVNKHNKMTSSR